MHPAHLNFQGESLLLDPAGALIWPRHALLAVADLHLEKGSACAGRGQLVPPWDSALTLARLAALMRRYAPRILVALGDSFHDRFAASRLSGADRAMLNAITGAARMVWVLAITTPFASRRWLANMPKASSWRGWCSGMRRAGKKPARRAGAQRVRRAGARQVRFPGIFIPRRGW